MTANLFTHSEMLAIFSPAAHVRWMLEFEAALVRAQAQIGLIPQPAAAAIAAACRIELYDVAALYAAAALAGTPAIPLVRALTEQVPEPARAFVHWGATSQDLIDSALMLQAREGLDLLDAGLLAAAGRCVALAQQHRNTLMAGRTLLQQALPISFGLKAARWLALITRQLHELRSQRARLALQLGGAAGTLAALGADGLRVVELVAGELGLLVPELPWHAERDRVARLASVLAITAGAMSKIAHDIVLLMQSEVSEAFEAAAPGKGGSSAMPHKRNPVDAVAALAAARLALGVVPVVFAGMTHEHERAAGAWQAEWAALPELFGYCGGAVECTRRSLDGLEVDVERMRANLDTNGGLLMAEALTMALAAQLGREQAQVLVQAASSRALAGRQTLRAVALDDAQIRAVLDPAAIDAALDPAAYLGSADLFVERAIAGYQQLLA